MQDASDYPVDHLAGGPDPVLVLVLGAVIIGLMIAAYLLGRNFENRRAAFDHRRSAQDIHTAIARWAVGASKASSGELLSYAQGLLDEIEGRIGPAHILAKGSGAHMTELKAALAGKTPEKPKTEPAKNLAETTVLMPALVSAGGYDGDHREVLTPGFVAQRSPAPDPKKAEAPNGTMKEQLMRLRLAIEEFASYWCGSPGAVEARVQELVAAQKALCHTGPLPLLPARRDGGRGH
jgi:hypothetical protein